MPLALFGLFYLLLTQGAASISDECDSLVCAQLWQAILAGLGTLALFAGLYLVIRGSGSAAKVVCFGTLPLLVLHIVFVFTIPDESIFFPLSTAPPPVVAGAFLLLQRRSVR